MIPGNPCNEAKSGMKVQEIAVKLITFVYKVFRPSLVRAHLGKAAFGGQNVANGDAELLKCPDGHGCGGCFAVGTGYGNEFQVFLLQDFIE